MTFHCPFQDLNHAAVVPAHTPGSVPETHTFKFMIIQASHNAKPPPLQPQGFCILSLPPYLPSLLMQFLVTNLNWGREPLTEKVLLVYALTLCSFNLYHLSLLLVLSVIIFNIYHAMTHRDKGPFIILIVISNM